MKIRSQIFTVLCAAGFAAALTGAVAAEPKSPDLAVAGERILSEKCAQCHALGKTGSSPLAAAPPFRSLAAKYPLDHLAEALAEGITTGHPDMPEFVFSTDEIAAILAYIEDISEPRAAK
jgi:mono/diheme cytochrome c family protein